MIINPPEIRRKNGWICVASKIVTEQTEYDLPETLWFEYPEKYTNAVTDRSDAFVVGLTLTAMKLQEKLEVRGSVSPRLAFGLDEWRQVFNRWDPEVFSLIDVQYERLFPLDENRAGTAGAASFSGGVDSFYTVMQRFPSSGVLPEYGIQYALFVHGFDIPLSDEENYHLAAQGFEGALAPLGVELIPCRTNLHAFSAGLIPWGMAHGSALISAGMVLSGLIGKFFIPSSYKYNRLRPWGSSPLIDHLLCTELFQVIHDGASMGRLQKVKAISNWPPAQNNLRVCTNLKRRHGVENCSRCEKCLRTMTMLKVVGRIKEFKTFKQPYRDVDILRWAPVYELGGVGVPQLWPYAHEKKEYTVMPFLAVVYLTGLVRHWILKLIPRGLFGWLKEKFYPAGKDPFATRNLDPGDGC